MVSEIYVPMAAQSAAKAVLIVVLVEGLGEAKPEPINTGYMVLILVLVEDGLGACLI